MYKKLLTTVVLFTIAFLAAGEGAFARGTVLWTKSYGNPNSVQDLEVSLTKVNTLYIEPANFRYLEDYHTRKRNTNIPVWSKTIGGPHFKEGRTVLKDLDMGSLIAGYTRTSSGDYEVYLTKTDADGETVWTKTYQASSSDKHAVSGWTLSFSAGKGDVYRLRLGRALVEDRIEEENETSIETFQLSQNYPNPFNPSTTISYRLPEASLVTLKIYNIIGQEVKTLVNGRQAAGAHSVIFDARNFATGYYIYRLEAGKSIETKKMLLVK